MARPKGFRPAASTYSWGQTGIIPEKKDRLDILAQRCGIATKMKVNQDGWYAPKRRNGTRIMASVRPDVAQIEEKIIALLLIRRDLMK